MNAKLVAKSTLGVACMSAAAWMWLAVGRGAFWRAGPSLRRRQPKRFWRVTAVIPARNEELHIAACLRSLLDQRFTGELRIVLVDDNSTDATGVIAGELAATDDRLRVLNGARLPAGWSGKLWAVAQGLRQPEAVDAEYVLLCDADIVHGREHVASLVAHAESEGAELVSEMVKLRTESFAERATIPAFVFFFAMLYPFRWVNDRSRTTAAAAGGTMLVARAALDRIDGVNRIRSALIDDVALAREIKRDGYPIWLGHASGAISLREYPEFRDVWNMVARTAYVQLEHSPWLLLGTVSGMLLLYAAPVAMALAGRGRTRWLGLASWATMSLLFQPTLRGHGRSWLWGPALPGIAVFYLAATVGSAARFYKGEGGAWKGRVYARPHNTA